MPRHVPLIVTSLILIVSGCTYERGGSISSHYSEFSAREPTRSTVAVCSAYGCKTQTKVRFASKQINQIKKVMSKYRRSKGDTPHGERVAVAYAVGWMEQYVGKITGTSADRPGMEYLGSGDPTQQDCVDEATNTTSYLLILQRNGLLKHHKVGTPFSKGNLLLGGVKNWPHWTAVLNANKSGTRFAVDSWIYENGENPAIVEADKWYLTDLDNLPKPTG